MAVDEKGLWVEVDLPNTTVGKDVAESVGRGDIRGMSFKIDKPVYQITGADNRGKRTLTLMDMVIPEVSVVSNPAYIDTEVSLRCLQDLQAAEGRQKARERGYYLVSSLPKYIRASPKPATAKITGNNTILVAISWMPRRAGPITRTSATSIKMPRTCRSIAFRINALSTNKNSENVSRLRRAG